MADSFYIALCTDVSEKIAASIFRADVGHEHHHMLNQAVLSRKAVEAALVYEAFVIIAICSVIRTKRKQIHRGEKYKGAVHIVTTVL